jgi:hypothetical protein
MGALTGQDLRQHAQEVAQGAELARQVLRELALQRGLLERLLHAQQNKFADEAGGDAFNALVGAVFISMGPVTWTVDDLFRRIELPDLEANRLQAALAANGRCKARALGMQLAALVPGESYLTPCGYELRRSGKFGARNAWTIAKV